MNPWTITAAVAVYAAVMTFLFFVAMSGIDHERKRGDWFAAQLRAAKWRARVPAIPTTQGAHPNGD